MVKNRCAFLWCISLDDIIIPDFVLENLNLTKKQFAERIGIDMRVLNIMTEKDLEKGTNEVPLTAKELLDMFRMWKDTKETEKTLKNFRKVLKKFLKKLKKNMRKRE